MATDELTKGTVKSDELLLKVILGLKELDGAGVTELARHIGEGKSTVHKHLKTLYQHKFLVKKGTKYHLGLQFFTLGGWIRDRNALFESLSRTISDPDWDLDEMLRISLEERGRGYFMGDIRDKYNLRQSRPVGDSFHLHTTAAGKSMLSIMPDERVNKILAESDLGPKTENTITDRESLLDEIEQSKERGYALNMGERLENINALAVAIQHPNTGEFGAVSILGPAARLTREKLEKEYADELLQKMSDLKMELRFEQ